MSVVSSRQNFPSGGGSVSTMSVQELPNLPGMRRNVASINPRLYKEFKAATVRKEDLLSAPPTAGQFATGQFRYGENFDDDESFSPSYAELSRSLSAFPQQSTSFNDNTGRYSLVSQKEDRERNIRTIPFSDTGSQKRSFVNADRTVLSFQGYFTEYFEKSAGPQSRKVQIKFYVEDNSIEVIEPKVENSGGPSGKFLKRHQVLKTGTKEMYCLEDFYSGAQLQMYERVYYITDADNASKLFLTMNGIDFGTPRALPDNVFDPKSRPGMPRKSEKAHDKKHEKKHGVLGFFEYDRKILRFYGAWDSREALYGDDLRVKLHYCLADGTMEIVPMHERNSGRDKLPKFFKKNPIMKPRPDFMMTTGTSIDADSLQGYSATGIISSGSMLSLLGEGPGIEPASPYHWTDLKIGQIIPVAAYNLQLIDADEFTRSFYASKELPLGAPIIPAPPVYPEVSDEPPPPLMAQPTKSKEEGIKAAFFMGVSLRFKAVFTKPKEADKSREFVIQYFMENDTVQVMEPQIRNSGHKGGLFLARSQPKGLFSPRDLFLGNTVKVLKHEFLILDADMATFKFMEQYPDTWLECNVQLISEKMKKRKEPLTRVILTYPGLEYASIDMELTQQLYEQAGLSMVKQEAKTIFRVIDPFHTGTVKMSKLLKFVLDL